MEINMKKWIVLPAFNEAENLPDLFRSIKRIQDEDVQGSLEVVLVDDGSSDATFSVVQKWSKEFPMQILRNDPNRGLAYTFQRGMTAAIEQSGEGDVIICMDADNTHLPGLIPTMVRSVQEGRDVVIASRYQHGAVLRGVAPHRQLMSTGMSWLFRLLSPVPGVRDYSCGYRAYRAAFMKQCLAQEGASLFAGEGFACMVGMLLQLHRCGGIMGEVPMVLRYHQKKGASAMNVVRTVFLTCKLLLKARFGLSLKD
jgi:dolichol-phosphate mannosyltransferase